MKYFLRTCFAALLFSALCNADDKTGKIVQVQIIGDAHPTPSVRGNIHVYVDDMNTYYVIPSSETQQKALLSLFLTAKTTGVDARIISDGSGPGTRIIQAMLP